jgi:TolA-binding protein
MALRPLSRLLPLLLAVGGWLLLGASPSEARQPSYEDARQAYFSERLAQATRELILEEKLLTWRLGGIATELRRSGRLPREALGELLDPDPPTLEPEALPADSTAPFADRAEVWIGRQREILAWKQARAILLRERLVLEADAPALEAQFRRDLEGAITSYGQGDWPLSRRQLEDILALYPYANLDDVQFHAAEAALAEGAWDTAVHGYRALLREHPQSAYRQSALRHLLYLRSAFGQHNIAVDECREFAEVLAAGDGELVYLAGREYFLSERFAEARRLLEGVSLQDGYAVRARHLIGLSLILDNRYGDAIPVFEELVSLPRQRGFGVDANERIREDARLKLGYLYFEEGRFAEAGSMFEAVPHGSERHPEALLGDAWSSLSLSDNRRALELARELVAHYPSSPFRYEAQTLAGFASEQLERQDEAELWYARVLDEAERGEALRELAAERRQILQLLRQLVRLEREVFEEGREDSFEDYVAMRGRAQLLMRRVKYGELLTAQESMREFVEERREITALNNQLRELIARSAETADASSREEIGALNRQLRRLQSRIRLAGFIEIQRQPLMHYESTLVAAEAMLDSLAIGSRQELGLLRKDADLAAASGDSPREELAQTLFVERVESLGDRVEVLRSRATQLKRRPAGSDLSRWSELAFSRMAIGDIRFSDLDRIEERLEELDGYLARIDELLQTAPAEPAAATEERP